MTDYERILKLYNQIDDLLALQNTFFSTKIQSWYKDCIRVLSNAFGKDSVELQNFKDITFAFPYMDNQTLLTMCNEGLEIAKQNFKSILEEMNDNKQEKHNIQTANIKDKIFIVHGHDENFKYKTAHFLNKLGLSPIILQEQTNMGDTVIEKLEKAGQQAKAAIILFTPDDVGRAISEQTERERARQNVVFEAGYFIGLLGRKNTLIIKSNEKIEMPSDLEGIAYDNDTSEYKIARELHDMGIDIDLNKLLK